MTPSLVDLAWPDAERASADAILAVPVGATEQHGPHLPIGTDTEIAIGLARELCRRRAGIVLGPPVAYGCSGEHAGFAGTVSIGQSATERLLVELGRSAALSFRRMLLISTHGGNAEPVSRAVRTLTAEGRDVRCFTPSWGGDAHAGRTETSLMLALRPELVRLDRARAGATAPLAEIVERLRSEGVRAVSDNGVLGDPAGASAEEGRLMLADAARRIVRLVDEWSAA